jgi:hypothetical protein
VLAGLEILPFAAPTDAEYARPRAMQEQRGQPIGGNDLFIAAHALVLGCCIVTGNDREFARTMGWRGRTGCFRRLLNEEEYALDQAIGFIIFVLLTLAGLVMEFIGFVDGLLGSLMTALHVPENAQLILLVVVALWLVVLAFRALGGVFGALLLVLLVLLLLHQALPGMHVPPAHYPEGGQGNTLL